jgi:hypothetical protein
LFFTHFGEYFSIILENAKQLNFLFWTFVEVYMVLFKM